MARVFVAIYLGLLHVFVVAMIYFSAMSSHSGSVQADGTAAGTAAGAAAAAVLPTGAAGEVGGKLKFFF